MKAMLLRVGIDRGTDGALAPIFEDGTFEYIPISEKNERSTETRTYEMEIGRSGKPLSKYLPKRAWKRRIHYDPEFETCTYGDPTSKRRYLLKLENGDLLVFYAGLTPFQNLNYKEGLYIIGFFTVDRILDFNMLSRQKITRCYKDYPNNAHLKGVGDTEDLAIVIGEQHRSKLMNRAILISRTLFDKSGRPCQAVSSDMEGLLGISGFIQRSIPPRLVRNRDNVENLGRILNHN